MKRRDFIKGLSAACLGTALVRDYLELELSNAWWSEMATMADFSAGEKIRCGPLMINDYGCVEVNGWLVLSKQER